MVKATLQGGVYQINCVPNKTYLKDLMRKRQFQFCSTYFTFKLIEWEQSDSSGWMIQTLYTIANNKILDTIDQNSWVVKYWNNCASFFIVRL